MDNREYYIEQYRAAHKSPDTFPGISIRYYVNGINKLIRLTSSKTLLDFGCGKGEQYTNAKLMSKWGKTPDKVWGIMPTLYDPAVEKYQKLPEGKFDGVISTDVMEHVPEDSVDFVFSQIFSKCNKFVFLAIATYVGRPTSLKLPNGQTPHITVHPSDWWIERVKTYIPDDIKVWISFNNRNKGKKNFTHWEN